MTLKVLEVGPGINPSNYAFDRSVQYIGVDPDMHYRVTAGFTTLMARLETIREDLSDFTYKRGVLLGDVLAELTDSQDRVVMANVLGDSKSYKNVYSGYFVDPETGVTRQTGIRKPDELIAQALTCLITSGSLIIIENAICSDNMVDHKTPEEFIEIISQAESVDKLIGAYAVYSGLDYIDKMRTLYFNVSEEPTENYYETCFVAELERATN